MKQYVIASILALSLALSQGASAAPAAPAASAAPAFGSVAIIDVKKILSSSSATKNIQEQIESLRKNMQSEISKKEDDLKKEDQKLAEQRSVLAPDAFKERSKQFNEKVAGVQRDVQLRRNQLENSYAKAMAEVQKVVESIIGEIATKKG